VITGYLIMYVNRILDRADRIPGFPSIAALLCGAGIGGALHGAVYGWACLPAGLILAAIRPGGTCLRRYLLIRQLRRELSAMNEHTGMTP